MGFVLLWQASRTINFAQGEFIMLPAFGVVLFEMLTGKRLFGAGAVPATLRLVSSSTTSKGAIVSVYRRAGSLKTGSFALD